MEVYLASAIAFLVAMIGMSMGAILNGRQIKGHCGNAAAGESCLEDAQGRKIINCDHCDCDS